MPELPQHTRRRASSVHISRTRRGLLILFAGFLGISWMLYMGITTRTSQPSEPSDQSRMLNPEATGEDAHIHDGNGGPAVTDIIQLIDLPSHLLPSTDKHRHSGRLIVVGDVHGMKDALVELLEKVQFDERRDHLILAGDMISKGPDSPGVIDLAMKLGATGVRGNHEDRILLAEANMGEYHFSMEAPGPSEDIEKTQDALERGHLSHGDYKDRALVKALGKKRLNWLKKCPVIVRVGNLVDMGEVVVVHAGLAPGVKLENQDPTMVMNMRTIHNGVPSDEHDGTGWTKVWNKHQRTLPKEDRSTVIYGHDSKRGLQVQEYSFGIDTGCVKSGKLTAVVISTHTKKVVHVDCKDERWT